MTDWRGGYVVQHAYSAARRRQRPIKEAAAQDPDVSVEKLPRVNKLLRTQQTLPAKLEAVVGIVKRTVRNCDAAGIIH